MDYINIYLSSDKMIRHKLINLEVCPRTCRNAFGLVYHSGKQILVFGITPLMQQHIFDGEVDHAIDFYHMDQVFFREGFRGFQQFICNLN
jgi:hypothetical protein